MQTYNLISLEKKEIIKKAGIFCLQFAVVFFFIDISAAMTLAVFGLVGILLRRIHGQRVEVAAGICFLAALILLLISAVLISPWTILGGILMFIAGVVLWGEGF